MTTEDVRVRLRAKLESTFGAEEASMLMDRPPGGWNDLVTNQMLDAKLDALRFDLVATLERGFRAQTWRLTTALLATVTLMSIILRVV
ncbi:MAG: hypothetical protein EXQ79_08580 [Acidimicrobiia bacterium]|nr:hypothetical protein [Acidimicrobiia bacterium]